MSRECHVDTLSLIAGNESCNARCPYCVSKMTPEMNLKKGETQVNWRNFHKSYLLAREWGATTALITGKGEPLLYPGQITQYLEALSKEKPEMPMIELQTNGILLAEQPEKYHPYLQRWYDLGLNLIAVSIAHYDAEKNRQIYLPHKTHYPNLTDTIHELHHIGFSVRLTAVLLNGFLDQPKEVDRLITFARNNNVEQLTARPVNKPQESRDKETAHWVEDHHLTTDQLMSIANYLHQNGTLLQERDYGAKVYDIDGQNICLTNSLTLNPQSSSIRQLIFSPDGHLYYDWQRKGAILL